MMKKFVYKTLIFCIPIAIVIGIPTFILLLSKESFSNLDALVENNEDYIVGYAYDESNYKYLKWKELDNKNRQEIIALGSSRVLQFREQMFEQSFYNCGSMISSVGDFLPFLKTLPKDKYPKYLIMGLDQWMFNYNWDNLSNTNQDTINWKELYTTNFTIFSLRNVWKDLLKQKYGTNVLNDNFSINRIGLNVRLNNKGFVKDGSFSYGNQIDYLLTGDSRADDYRFQDTFSRIEKGNRRFEKGDNINEKALQILEQTLVFLNENNVKVIGIMPPFADAVYQKMAKSGQYRYMDTLEPSLQRIFKKFDFELWNLTQLGKYNSNDDEMLDGFHGSGVTYLKMLIYMVENGSVLSEKVNIEKLHKNLQTKKNNYIVY